MSDHQSGDELADFISYGAMALVILAFGLPQLVRLVAAMIGGGNG